MPHVDIDELKTHYELTGDRQPVLIFSNSLGTNLSMWEPQMAEMERRFRILRYDTRGQGGSSVTAGSYTIEQLGRDVVGLLDSLHINRAIFCGLSMGGMVGMWLGIHAPDRLHRLVLCNTAAKIGTKEVWNARIATVRRDGMKSVAASVVERWFTPEFRASAEEKVAWTREMLENSPREGYASCCDAIRDMDLRDTVGQIKTPTLVIYGGRDPVIPNSEAQFLTDRIRGAQQVELAAAHLSNIEQSESFTKALSDFLSE
jgi:3-oxoadipate enol-lactonase